MGLEEGSKELMVRNERQKPDHVDTLRALTLKDFNQNNDMIQSAAMWRISQRKTRMETDRAVTEKRSWWVKLLRPCLSDKGSDFLPAFLFWQERKYGCCLFSSNYTNY